MKQKLFLFLATYLGAPLLKLYFATLRISRVGWETVRSFKGRPAIYVFWHENMLVPLSAFHGHNVSVLISQHSDGEMIARIVRKFGNRAIRGSSTRGGENAYAEMKSVLLSGGQIGITPDGPRGPRRKMKPGAVRLAMETGLPIIPLAVVAEKFRRLPSWDRFLLVRPFSKCALIVGSPIFIDGTADESRMRRQVAFVEEKLDKLEGLPCL